MRKADNLSRQKQEKNAKLKQLNTQVRLWLFSMEEYYHFHMSYRVVVHIQLLVVHSEINKLEEEMEECLK